MSIKDMLKSSVLDQLAYNNANVPAMVIAMLTALIFGFVIYLVYKTFYGGVIYSRSYAVTLIGMSVMTCMVTLAISSNVVISLGMVGSLSIIRYRTAVKDPMDLLYMFWAVTVGIAIGAGMTILAFVASLVMIVMVIIAHFKPVNGCVYIAVIHYTGDVTSDDVIRVMGRRKYQVKSQTTYGDRTELAIEVFCRKRDLGFFDKIRQIEDVQDVTVIQYNGEYHG